MKYYKIDEWTLTSLILGYIIKETHISKQSIDVNLIKIFIKEELQCDLSELENNCQKLVRQYIKKVFKDREMNKDE